MAFTKMFISHQPAWSPPALITEPYLVEQIEEEKEKAKAF